MVSPRPAWPTPSNPASQLLVLCTTASRRGAPVASRHSTTMARRSTSRTRVANPCWNPPSRTPHSVARSTQHASDTSATCSGFRTPNPRSRTSAPRPTRHGRIPRTSRSTSSSPLDFKGGHIPVRLYPSNGPRNIASTFLGGQTSICRCQSCKPLAAPPRPTSAPATKHRHQYASQPTCTHV